MNDKIIRPKKDGLTKHKSKENILKIIILLIIIGFIVASFLIVGSKKRIIEKSFSSISNRFDYYTKLVEDTPTKTNKYTINGTVSPKLQIDSNDTLNTGINIDNFNKTKIDYELKKHGEDLQLNYDVKIDNQSVQKVQSIINNGVSYLNIDDGWKKIASNSIEEEDFNYLRKKVSNSIKNNLDKKYLSSKKDTIVIDGKTTKVKKVSVTLKDNDIYNIISEVLNDLKNDKKSKNILKNVNINIEEIKVNKDDFKEYSIIYSVYKKGTYGKYLAYDLSIKNKDNVIKLSYFAGNKDIIELSYNENVINITTTKQKNKFTSTLMMNNNEIAKIKYNKNKLKYTTNIDVYFDKYYFDIDHEKEFQKQDDSYKIQENIIMSIKYDNSNKLELTLNNTGTLNKKVDKIKTPNNTKEEVNLYELYNSLLDLINQYK